MRNLVILLSIICLVYVVADIIKPDCVRINEIMVDKCVEGICD